MRVLSELDRAEIESLRRRDEFFWLDLESPGDEEVRALGELFGFHPTVLEDVRNFGQRSKLDDYGQYVFVVFYAVRADAELVEVQILVSGSYVITVRRQHCDELVALRRTLGQDPRTNEQFILYRIFDALTDSFFPVLSSMDEEIDETADSVAIDPSDRERRKIFELKRKLVDLRRVVSAQRDMFARAIDQIVVLPGLEPSTRDYFRDVYDHLIRISAMIDSHRDLLTSAMEVYLSTVSNRLNEVTRQLTVIATIFLPLTFVTGFFGQNFGWMVDRVDSLTAFLIWGVGSLLVSIVLLSFLFRRRGFI